jgi:hypothetical protein
MFLTERRTVDHAEMVPGAMVAMRWLWRTKFLGSERFGEPVTRTSE